MWDIPFPCHKKALFLHNRWTPRAARDFKGRARTWTSSRVSLALPLPLFFEQISPSLARLVVELAVEEETEVVAGGGGGASTPVFAPSGVIKIQMLF